MKPMLAEDYIESKLTFPLLAQPKIDGVRSLNMLGKLTGRSLKQHKNRYVTGRFSHSALIGFDGEMAAERETHPDLCRITSSALSTIEGEPYVLWWLFDYVTVDTMKLPYVERFNLLVDRIRSLHVEFPDLAQHMRQIPCHHVETLDQLLELDSAWLAQGYEGSIVRRLDLPHKQGRSTVREGGLLRIKRFVEEEAVVIAVTEGESNQNEATINELGRTERSSHQANMIPNGLVGTLTCRALKQVTDGDKVLIEVGQEITISAGKLTAEERRYYWLNQDQIIGRTVKFKFFPKGIKDKPRFPTFQSFRIGSDMENVT